MNVAVYSGSFDPIHVGHGAIIRYLTENAGFDEVLLVVSGQNPFKPVSSYSSSAEERLEAARNAVRRHSLKARVSRIELEMPYPNYTVDTLDRLRSESPDDTFTLVMGADNLAGIRRWKSYVRILSEYGIAVYPRRGYDMESLLKELIKENPSYKILLMDAPQVDISSTEIREAASSGRDMSGWLL